MGTLLRRARPRPDFRVWPDAGDPDDIEYLIAWQAPADFLAALPRLKVLFSSGAGRRPCRLSAVPAHIPVAHGRARHHQRHGGVREPCRAGPAPRLLRYAAAKASRSWNALEVPPASPVLSASWAWACSAAPCWTVWRPMGSTAWLEPFAAAHAGRGELRRHRAAAALPRGCDVLVCLLPLTPATRGILEPRSFLPCCPPSGADQRGPRAALVDADLIEALDSGRCRARFST